MGSKDNLVIWCSDEQWKSDYEDVLLWRSYEFSETKDVYSLPKIVEDNATHLRSQYLALIYALGEAKFRGKKIVKHLEIRPEFSFWWTTLISEKSNFANSPQINNVIKLMAFRDWLEGRHYKNILLVSSNIQLGESMHLLLGELGVGFQWEKNKQKKSTKSIIKRIYNRLPYSLKGFIWLPRDLISNWPLKGAGVEEWKRTKAKITFVSYLFNLNPDSLKEGDYESPFWTTLPQVLGKQCVESNWLHIYIKDALIPNSIVAKKTIKRFNQSHTNNQVHVTLYSFLSIKLAFSVLRDWYQLTKVKKLLEKYLQKQSGVYWPFFKNDFLNSMIGPKGMSNLIYLSLFESAMSKLPHQQKGVYLRENLSFESSLLYAWRNAGHSQIIGVIHTPLRYWDLRTYYDPKCYDRAESCRLPLPDFVAAFGRVDKQMYLDSGYPKSGLVEVEALRYLHLRDVLENQTDSKEIRMEKKVILILGSYLKDDTMNQMEMLRKAVTLINNEVQYIVKSHPRCPIREEDYPELDLMVRNDPIPLLIGKCSMVYTGNQTSAAVDAYCLGRFVVSSLDPSTLNFSPLRDCEGVSFVSSPEELAAAVNRNSYVKIFEEKIKNYFNLNPELPKWRELLIENDKGEKRVISEGVQ